MRSQSAIETIIIFSISSLIVLILLNAGINNQIVTIDILRMSQAREAAREIVSAAKSVWSQGYGATKEITIKIPAGINESVSGIINNKEVFFKLITSKGESDISEISPVNITGAIPLSEGIYNIKLVSYGSYVSIYSIGYIELKLDNDTYCKGATITYNATAYNESGVEIVNITVQLINTSGSVVDENITLSGENGTLTIPYQESGEWQVYAFNNKSFETKNINVISCGTIVNETVFFEDFVPRPYYDYNWTRVNNGYICWKDINSRYCYSAGGCAFSDGFCSETDNWIETNDGLIDLSDALAAYIDFWITEDTSFDPGEYLKVWCYDGSNWKVIYSEDAGDWTINRLKVHRYAIVDSSCLISNAKFKITIESNARNEDFFLDDFRVIKEVLR